MSMGKVKVQRYVFRPWKSYDGIFLLAIKGLYASSVTKRTRFMIKNERGHVNDLHMQNM